MLSRATTAPAHKEADRLGRKWLQDGRLAEADPAELSVKLDSLAELYRQHIHMEDHEVFPAASKILTADDRKAIGEEMAARRGHPSWMIADGRSMLVPREHGAWGLLLQPFLCAAILGRRWDWPFVPMTFSPRL